MNTASSGLDQYIPQRDWFARTAWQCYAGTHGIGHITRVLVWTNHLAELLDRPLRREELYWAAGLHDIGRHDDGIDAPHGERAATWVLRQFARERPAVAGQLDLEFIASLCRDHVRSDESISSWALELKILKDADGLERVRIHDLDPRRLRLPESPPLEPAAWELMRRSVANGNTAEAVRSVATDMGLWR
jgi:HD superfamily phosphodiesterase